RRLGARTPRGPVALPGRRDGSGDAGGAPGCEPPYARAVRSANHGQRRHAGDGGSRAVGNRVLFTESHGIGRARMRDRGEMMSELDRPAIAGGSPAKTTPFGRTQRYGDEELAELREALEQGTLFYAHGKKVRQ